MFSGGVGSLPVNWPSFPDFSFPSGPFGSSCGPQGSVAATWIPDFNTEACDEHDQCYGFCAENCLGNSCKNICDAGLGMSIPAYGAATYMFGGEAVYNNLEEQNNCNDCIR